MSQPQMLRAADQQPVHRHTRKGDHRADNRGNQVLRVA